MKTCDNCLHSRTVISENGFHGVCVLSSKKAMDCITGRRDHFVESFVESPLLRNRQEENNA